MLNMKFSSLILIYFYQFLGLVLLVTNVSCLLPSTSLTVNSSAQSLSHSSSSSSSLSSFESDLDSSEDLLPFKHTRYLRSPQSFPSSSESSSQLGNSSVNPQDKLIGYYGLLVATGRYNGTAKTYCMIYYNSRTIAHKPEETHFYNLTKIDHVNFCSLPMGPDNTVEAGSYIMINYNTKCSLADQAAYVQANYPDSKGLIVSMPNDVIIGKIYVKKNFTVDPKFIIGLIGEDAAKEILTDYGSQSKALVYSPIEEDESDSIFQSGLVGIWLVAVITVSIGGYSSGILRYELFLNRQLLEDEIADAEGGEVSEELERRRKKMKNKLDEATLDVTPITVVFFVIYMCTVLMILYFFYSYLVFMMIIFFVVFCAVSIYSLIMGLTVNYVSPRLIKNWSKIVWRVGVTIVSLIAPITWFIIRKSNQSWCLQDALAMVFCVHVLQMLRFPNYRITSLLLSLLFVYDIFFVFITPYLTSDGESIMVKVATGGAGSEPVFTFGAKDIGESLPVVFQWPKTLTPSLREEKCFQARLSYSKLGFGDVLVPGFLVSYCHALDLFQKTPFRIYFVAECIAYGFGLIMTFIALNLMNQAQPALLYLVPATLIPPYVIAWFRGELTILWYGPEPAAIQAKKKRRTTFGSGEGGTSPDNQILPTNQQEQNSGRNSPNHSLVSKNNQQQNTQETQVT